MKQFRFSTLCLIAALAVSIHTAAGQVTNATVQNVSSRPAPSRGAPVARPVVNAAIAPHVVPRSMGFVPRTVVQSAPNLLPNYPAVPRSSNPTVAATNAPGIRRISGQQPIAVDPAIRQNELRILAAMRKRPGFGNENRTLPAINPQRQVITRDPRARPQLDTPGS